MYDCIIIGAGPAGLTAAIYLVRKRIKTLVLTKEIGGQIMDGPLIENYPGFEKISGPEWVEKVKKQTENLEVEFKLGSTVQKIAKTQDYFQVTTVAGESFEAKTILIASGKSPRKLNVPGEDKYQGKGISSCVTCDGPLFRNKIVAVIGGGNSAVSAALELEKYAEKVYVINLGGRLVGEEVRLEKIDQSSKIEVIPQAKTTAVFGNDFLKGLKYLDLKTKQEKELPCEGIFVEIGWVPSTAYLEGFIELTPTKDVKIDAKNSTNVSGVFAAGDVTQIKDKQIIVACGEAAKAALAVGEYLSSKK